MSAVAMACFSKIITFDIPDPDNFLMALRLLKDHPDETVALVLSPRPVCFRAAPYGKRFKSLLANIEQSLRHEHGATHHLESLRRLIGCITDEEFANSPWIIKMDVRDRPWFYVDPDFSDSRVRENTKLYMQLSALRLISYLESNTVGRERYTIFWSEHSFGRIVGGVRHAFHSPDFSFDFNQDQMERYNQAIADNVLDQEGNVKEILSDKLGREITQICNDYIAQKSSILGVDIGTALRPFQELISDIKISRKELCLFVGGPLTEALTITQNGWVKEIYAMGGFINGDTNLFPNQFNFLVDLDSTRELLSLAQIGQLKLVLLPTECVKGSAYALSRAELLGCLSDSPSSIKLYKMWDAERSETASSTYSLFDLVLAIAANVPDLLVSKYVVPYIDCHTDGTDVIKFRPQRDGKIVMFWNNVNHMSTNRQRFLQIIRKTFQ